MELKRSLVEGRFFNTIRDKIDQKIGSASRKLVFKKSEVKSNKLFVMTYDRHYSDNQKFIVEELLKRDLPIDIVWVGAKSGKFDPNFPKQVRVVPYSSYEMFAEQASAKVWLDNALNCVWFNFPKKKNQYYLNTWHGSMGIKRLGGNAFWMDRAKLCDKKTDFCITNSTFEENVFRSTFWPSTPFLKYGHARNDVLLHPEEWPKTRDAVTEYLEIPKDKKILLYAPTFRDDGDTSCFNMDYKALKDALDQKFGGDWVILVRLHFKNRSNAKNDDYEECDWLYDATMYPDMQELMIASDIGITDYSSWAYDYVLTKKPMFIYARDIERYNTSRGFYFTLESTPFAIARNNKQLVEAVAAFDEKEYAGKVEDFLKDKGCYETGEAAKLIADKICELMELS